MCTSYKLNKLKEEILDSLLRINFILMVNNTTIKKKKIKLNYIVTIYTYNSFFFAKQTFDELVIKVILNF